MIIPRVEFDIKAATTKLASLATLSCVALTLSGCLGQHVSLNYVVEATIKVGDEIATGSSVWSMDYLPPGDWLSSMSPHITSSGEAIPVKLADGRYVFILRRHGQFSNPGYGAFPYQCVGGVGSPDKIMAALLRFVGPCQVSEEYPTMVMFNDRNDSTQYQRVEPTALQARSEYCPTICLMDLTVRATKDPISTGLEGLLPWLTALRGKTDIQHLHTGFAAYPALLYLVDFSTPLNAAAFDREQQELRRRLSK